MRAGSSGGGQDGDDLNELGAAPRAQHLFPRRPGPPGREEGEQRAHRNGLRQCGWTRMMIMKMIASGMPENQSSALVPNLMLATPLIGGNSRLRFSFPRKGRTHPWPKRSSAATALLIAHQRHWRDSRRSNHCSETACVEKLCDDGLSRSLQ